ncbi:RNA-processing protein [Candidatus Bathyarchaeota archaeon]|nr:MAG: RNA-processing protein [Candidatus Hecatellales archaeon]RLI35173.1 MAG: RNA-processing protein [Candidatus Bathyarchaeota archaeon]
MSQGLRVRIPMERVGVLIGPKGSVKRQIERYCKVKLLIDSESGEVEILPTPKMDDPSMLLKAQSIVLAIGRGFSPEKALKLLDDEYLLEIIDLRSMLGHSRKNLIRVKGRIIGEKGRTRRIIEETTGVDISIYGHTVAIIGRHDEVAIAREAVHKLISGSEHSTVYRMLGRRRHELKRERLKLWEPTI